MDTKQLLLNIEPLNEMIMATSILSIRLGVCAK